MLNVEHIMLIAIWRLKILNVVLITRVNVEARLHGIVLKIIVIYVTLVEII